LKLRRIIKYILLDIIRSRFILIYFLFLLLTTLAMFQLETDNSKVIMSLLNIILLIVPLVSVMFTTIHFYNSYEFIILMLSQPINRRMVFLSEFIGVSLALIIAFLAGLALPVVIYGAYSAGATLIFSGVLLTVVFVALAFLSAVMTRDKAKAIGVGLMFWFYATLIYDAFLMWVLFQFSDYPLDATMLVLISLNPIDLARIILMLQLDISALMGYTGAFYKNFFGSGLGMLYSVSILFLWILVPLLISMRIFNKKDL